MDITASAASVSGLSLQAKLEIVLRKAAALLPADIGNRLLALVTPTSLAIMAGVVLIWAGSHFVGVGEIADVILLAAGWLMIGTAAVQGGEKLLDFAVGTHSAKTTADLDKAAKDLADAITILGVDVVLGLLLKGKPKGTFKSVQGTMPSYSQFTRAMPKAGPMRIYEAKLVFSHSKFAGQGGTRPDNVATIGRDFFPGAKPFPEVIRSVRQTVYHERIHQRLTQAFSLLGRPGLYMKMGAYKRSYILRYIEEAAAEAYGLARTGGARPGELSAIQFPLNGNYGITVAKMGEEAKGVLLGPITVGGATYNAFYGAAHNDH
ncbi:hypothetical protein [Agrobacterium vitis]|uniref:hypothetical protein n=1 Tax=Agrobacterium vitis TaxID=373 RepID=UPI0015730677|nr:hypothetical protein [Agrobacterium vitis]NSZ17490.1 hypothetical protein [Agrobacterium vitis]QZO03187.1 hypothetical protein K4831_12145 [Agrobacterium vitis]UJL88307.1 hypothetical protein AVF2S5_10485 [Agrobacterium vitis]